MCQTGSFWTSKIPFDFTENQNDIKILTFPQCDFCILSWQHCLLMVINIFFFLIYSRHGESILMKDRHSETSEWPLNYCKVKLIVELWILLLEEFKEDAIVCSKTKTWMVFILCFRISVIQSSPILEKR